MGEFKTLAKTGDIAEGAMASFEANDTKVAVANVAGTFYAFDDVCTHQQCPLSDGDLEGTAVTCPCHGSRFDVTSGAVLGPPATEPVRTFAVRVQDDSIAVEI